MWGKFQKYWSDFNPILSIALVFDPRYKMQIVEFFYKKAYGENSIELASMWNKLERLFEEYKAKCDQGTGAGVSPSVLKKESKNNAVPTMVVDIEDELLKVMFISYIP